jgi:uncharacterized membrane protein
MTQEAHKNLIIDTRSFVNRSARLDERRNLLVESVESLESLVIAPEQVVPEQVIKNVEAITSHQERYQQEATTPQRVLEKITAIFGRSEFLYFQIAFFTAWAVGTRLVHLNILPSNFPLFDLREQGLDAAALLISTGVLVYETRKEKIDEERSHLMLQLNLLTEQKIAKLISLVEELRTDLPNVSNRFDLEAEMMKQASDPQAILEVIQQNLEQPPSPPEDKLNDA